MLDQTTEQTPSILAEGWQTFKKLDTKQISDWMTLILKAATGFGGFVLVTYAAKEHFFYDLSSLAAVALLLVAGLAFSFLVAAAALYAALALLWVTAAIFLIISCAMRLLGLQPKVRLRPALVRWHVIGFSVFLFLLLAATITNDALRHPIPTGILQWALMSGFAVDCMIVAKPIVPASDDSVWRKRFRLILAMPVLLLFWRMGAFSDLLDRSVINLSFRSEPEQFISISDPSYRKVDVLAHLAAIQLSSCKIGEASWLLRGATLVWHGIGATSYLRITGKSDVSLLIPIPSNDVEAIHADSLQAIDCGTPPRLNPP